MKANAYLTVEDSWVVGFSLFLGSFAANLTSTTDLVFNGGKYGMWVGNQQYVKHLPRIVPLILIGVGKDLPFATSL